MKFFKKLLSATLATTMLFASFAVNTTIVPAAPSIAAGWNETLYAEWVDSNPDSTAVQVGYKLSTDADYTYLSGDDLTYLVRPSSTSGYGRVDIPGLKAGRYDLYIKASDGTEHTRKGIKVYAYDRSGYAHWTSAGGAESYDGIGGYNNDGTVKDNAIIVYVTDENKDTFTIPGYENTVYNYLSSSTGATWTRTTEGIGNLLNNNMKFIQELTITNNHPIIIRFIGKVTVPKNLTPYNVKDPALGGSKGDNGNLAICKYGRNITLEGIGPDATIEGWGFTFSQTSTCPPEAGKSFEVRNLTFDKYTEDALGFQGDDGVTCPIERVWVHNNVFYPGYCANPAESDKAEGDGSCDFKRGQYYTMAYNHYINCHKTNLVGSGTSDDQFNISLHHNWYQNVGSRQPLAANGNMHIYSTYFQGATSTSVDLRGKDCVLLENNYYDNCKSNFKSRNATCIAKSYNEIFTGSGKYEEKGKRTVVSSLDEAVLTGSSYSFSDGTSIDNFDLDSSKFYKGSYFVTPAAEVPEYVQTYAGTLKTFPEIESGEIIVNVKSGSTPVTDASVTANGLTFSNKGNGVYTATAALGSEYVITVSKEGYSNVVIKSDVLNNDGDTFTATADLKVDYDGYAVVKLVGGSENAPVKGATVKLTDGTVLIDQNDGTYKSANQIAVGNYSVTITNTGDYIAPSSAQAITVKSTDAATEIHLDKLKGAVSVTLQAAEGETKELDASGALVYVGLTALTYAGNNTFTGNVDINTPFAVSLSVGGWHLEAITPAQITATKEGTASAVATLKAGGALYTWNYTEGTNTDDFFVFASEPSKWSGGSDKPQTFDGETLTAAIKVQSSTTITFNAPADGTLRLVIEDAGKTNSTIDINGTDYPVTTGTVTIPVTAGINTIKKGKNETHLYLLQYEMGDNPGPGPIITTESTTESTTTASTTTETTTEAAPLDYTPVELGEAVTNSGTGISVTYDAATDTWTLTDTSASLAAELTVPVVTPITKGKVIVTGSATPSAASGKWAFVKVMGKTTDATGAVVEAEVAALATDSNKYITLRTDSKTYAASTDAITANKKYDYTFVIDLDAKTVELTVNGNTYTGTVNTTEITGFGAITSVSGSRNVSLSNTVIGTVNEGPATLHDEIMWDVTVDFPAEGSNGLTAGETFYANSEETGSRDFVDGDNTYQLADWLQPSSNPTDSRNMGPMSEDKINGTKPTGIPVSGGFLKFTPEKNGVFTMAVKTGGDKVTYVTDENGAVVTMVDNTAGTTRYDIVRFNVEAGKSYHIFANGSKTCLYYLGYTSGITIPVDPTESTSESTTESTTESSSESTTESTSESTTEEPGPGPTPVKLYGDADADGDVDISDVAMLLQHVLGGTPYTNDFEYVDVDKSGKIDSEDVAMILQNVLDKSFTLPR